MIWRRGSFAWSTAGGDEDSKWPGAVRCERWAPSLNKPASAPRLARPGVAALPGHSVDMAASFDLRLTRRAMRITRPTPSSTRAHVPPPPPLFLCYNYWPLQLSKQKKLTIVCKVLVFNICLHPHPNHHLVKINHASASS